MESTDTQKPDRAWKLFDRDHSWIVGCPAVDIHGKSCSPFSKNAVAWCALGGIMRVHGSPFSREVAFKVKVLRTWLFDRYGETALHLWNDLFANREEVFETLKEFDI